MSRPIKQSYQIAAPRAKVWQALVDPKLIKQWSGQNAIMDGHVGTEFSLWGGSIYGKNVMIEPEKKLVQEWYGGDWDAPSIVTFTLFDEPNGMTRLDILHTDVPEKERDDFDQGWKGYYCGAIQKLFAPQ